MASSENDDFDFELYRYKPSLAAAIIFCILFGTSTIHHVYKAIRTRTRYFIPLILGAIAETSGYSARAVSHFDKEKLAPYLVQSITIIIAPALFAASIYMMLGRLARILRADNHLLIGQRWLTKVFVVGDIISFLAQGSGSSIMAQGTMEQLRIGERIVIGGVFFQVLIFSIFLIVTIHFHIKILRHPTFESERLAQQPPRENWSTMLKAIHIAGGLIIVRSVFRGIDFSMGFTGPLLKNEAFLYVFDALLMVGALGVFNWCHPGEVVRSGKLAVDTSDSK